MQEHQVESAKKESVPLSERDCVENAKERRISGQTKQTEKTQSKLSPISTTLVIIALGSYPTCFNERTEPM